MNIFKYELKTYFKSTVIWSISIFAILLIFMSFYPAMSSDTQMLDKIVENYPPELLKAFGMGGSISLASVLGFFSFIFVFVQLCLAIQSAYYGFQFLSIEERELTADFLMSKPVSRTKIIVSKFFAAFTSLTITNAVTWAGSIVAIRLYNNGNAYDIKNILLLLASIVLFQLFFMSVGMIISVFVKKIRNVLSYTMAFAFGMYILNALKSIFGGEILGFVSPFYHFEPGYILENGTYNLPMVLISVGIILLSLTGSYILYLKRDIKSV